METEKLMSIPAAELARGINIGGDIPVTIVKYDEALSQNFARTMADEIEKNNNTDKKTSFILPVGPKGQYEPFVNIAIDEGIDLSRSSFFFMDEYLTDDDRYISTNHPLSFRAFVEETLTKRLTGRAGFDPKSVHFPNPADVGAYGNLIEDSGGIEVSFAGVGINGHLAFNEPPDMPVDIEEFLNLPTRVLSLSRETRTINSVTAGGGAIDYIPKRAVTVGMREIFSAKKIRIYMNRDWQKYGVRRALYGEISPIFPASLVRRHVDVAFVITEEVALPPAPEIR
ncbi:MAG: glucosamine-6-phosphate isomerase [Deltaproteobacteria bacterium]|uniref:Glucosamine-6-phosphate isomerase n=1 Tax=Candidatus Zymogenus saltonus TaxID=2844893 RepID=A0A9D8KHJ6_9DELT|nr:glucosamine-6-phosphate isomerase [Candidatus Zymogenus saltonus]